MKTNRHLACAIAFAALCSTAEARPRHHHGHHARHHHHAAMSYASVGNVFEKAKASRAIQIAMHYLGSRNPTGTKGPWCSDFNNLIEHRLGHAGIKSRMAPDWRTYGHASGPVPGAIAVFRGHVGRVISRVGSNIQIISGNWGHKVGIGWMSVRSAIAYRMP